MLSRLFVELRRPKYAVPLVGIVMVGLGLILTRPVSEDFPVDMAPVEVTTPEPVAVAPDSEEAMAEASMPEAILLDESRPVEPMAVESATPPPNLDTSIYWVQRVFFGTNREVGPSSPSGLTFTEGRANALTLGMADVTIPRATHAFGELERPSKITLFTVTLFEEREDASKHFTFLDVRELTREEFHAAAGQAARAATDYAGSAFLFIHGFNTPFDKAMFRAAQMAHDLEFDGPAFAYSWPSIGTTLNYVTDMDSAEIATPFLDEFIDHILTTPGVERLHIVAHSMGNAALAELLTRAGTRVQQRDDKFVDQLILAAPDLDVDKFRSIAHHFTRIAKGVTLYASANDKALAASKSLRSDFARVGDVPESGPVIISGIDTIDVSAAGDEMFSFNHLVFAENRVVLNDIGRLFATGERPPDHRLNKLRAVVGPGGGIFWRLTGE